MSLKFAILVLIISMELPALDLKWLYLSGGAYLDRWRGVSPTAWESRGQEPLPPQGAPPQSFYGLSLGGLWQWPINLQTGIHLNVFYNTIGAYDTYLNGEIKSLSDATLGLGDIRIQNRFKLVFIPGHAELNLTIPGLYKRSISRITPQEKTVDPWTGLGAFHLGLAYNVSWRYVSAHIHGKWALPSGERSQIDPGDYETGFRLLYKNTINRKTGYKAGLLGEYKHYHWKQLEGNFTQDLTLSPVLSASYLPSPKHEVAFNFGLSAFSWMEDEVIKDPSGRMFFGIYSGWYF